MGPVLIALLVVVLSIIAYALYLAYNQNKYWAERGVPHVKPMLLLGNIAPVIFRRKNISQLQQEIANKFPNEPVIGLYNCTKPILMIKDHTLIEKILIKDFMHFVDRGFALDRRNAFDISLFTLTGKEWRALRYKLSPLFTTVKLKQMYGAMAECGDGMITLLESGKSEDVDMREILGRFAMDVIGSCAFGIDAQNLSQSDCEFRTMGKKAFAFSLIQMLKFFILLVSPKIGQFLGLSFSRRNVGDYFSKIIKETVEYRKKNNVVRNDFLQSLMILKEKGSIELQIKDPIDDYLRMDTTYSIESFEINEDAMIGQAFSFLTTGFEITALATLFTLFELAKNPEIQERVRKEILKQMENEETLTYDVVKQMIYLEQCVKESLRKYPPATTIMRVCTKEYTLPNGLTISPGDSVLISTRVLHYDPQYFPEPEEFRPERFDANQTIPSCAYLPFSNGPRICIAMRFALMEVNYCLAKLLMNYEFRISAKSKPFQLSTKTFFTAPKYPILFDVKKITVSA